MATYFIADKQGKTVSQTTVLPLVLEEGQRISLVDYITVAKRDRWPNFTDVRGDCTLNVFSTAKASGELIVKIEILGDNPKLIQELHRGALQAIYAGSETEPTHKRKHSLFG